MEGDNSSRSVSPVSLDQDPSCHLSRSGMFQHRKRARVDDEIEAMLVGNGQEYDTPVPSGSSENPRCKGVRDKDYYMEDGSCVLRVENTLFNPSKEVDGRSDDFPLALSGDTVEEFKSFLWPHELMIVHSTNADITRLVNIARVSYKYHFKSIENWSLDVINDQISRRDSPLLVTSGPRDTRAALRANGNQISRLMRLAQLCGHQRLLSTMTTILQRFMGSHLHYAHLAMTLADELDLRTLRGVAYFEVMQKAVVVAREDTGWRRSPRQGDGNDEDDQEILDSKGRLIVSCEQQLRILQGYYKLTSAWEKLRVEPVHFEHAPTCNATWHLQGCTQSWNEFWKEKTKGDGVLQLGLADLLGRLKNIAKEFDRFGSASYMHHDCRTLARKAIIEKVRVVEEGLPDYFVDEKIS